MRQINYKNISKLKIYLNKMFIHIFLNSKIR
jgi:hypothetical protein